MHGLLKQNQKEGMMTEKFLGKPLSPIPTRSGQCPQHVYAVKVYKLMLLGV